jgi:hypothetical protein
LAADRYLTAVLSNQRFDREAGAVDAALTPELRTEWLKAADVLYAKVAARISAAKNPGDYGFLFGALFGRAAVAEDLGDMKAAEGYLKDIETRSKGTDFAAAGELAAKRMSTLQALATPVVLPSKPIAPMPAAIPDLTGQMAPNALSPNGSAPAAAPTAGEEMIRQLQGGSAPAPAAPTPAPAAPAPAAP